MDFRVRRGQLFVCPKVLGRAATSGPSDRRSRVLPPMVVGLLIGFLVLAAVGAAAVFLPRLIRGELGTLREQTANDLSARNAEVDRRLAGLEQTLSSRLTELDQRVDTRLAASATTAN